MFTPKYYREEDVKTILVFIRENEFATLVTYDGEQAGRGLQPPQC